MQMRSMSIRCWIINYHKMKARLFILIISFFRIISFTSIYIHLQGLDWHFFYFGSNRKNDFGIQQFIGSHQIGMFECWRETRRKREKSSCYVDWILMSVWELVSKWKLLQECSKHFSLLVFLFLLVIVFFLIWHQDTKEEWGV